MAGFETVKHHCDFVCDEIHGGPKRNWDECKNKCVHKKFFTVDAFRRELLPEKWRTEELMNYIKNRIERTVKITVSHISEKRPNTFPNSTKPYPFYDKSDNCKYLRYGTGYIDYVSFISKRCPCPCPECKESNQPKMEYWEVEVLTAAHVVFDNSEAKTAVIDIFYDNENDDRVRYYLYGVGVFYDDKERYETDKCEMQCVTHEKDLIKRLKRIYDDGKRLGLHFDKYIEIFGILVSHPHGLSKKISIGKAFQRKLKVEPEFSVTLAEGTPVCIPASDAKQEDTQHSCLEGSNDMSPYKKIKFSSQSIGDEDAKRDEVANVVETVTSSIEDTFLTQIEEKKLKVEMKVFSPPNSFIVSESLKTNDWYTFPPGTKYEYESRGETKSVVESKEIKFLLSNQSGVDRFKHHWFLTYDMATCPGSSGAFVGGLGLLFNNWIHFGSNNGKGKSGLSHFLKFDITDIHATDS